MARSAYYGTSRAGEGGRGLGSLGRGNRYISRVRTGATSQRPITFSGSIINRGGGRPRPTRFFRDLRHTGAGRSNRYVNRVRTGATSQRPITRSGTIINRGGGRGNRYISRVRTGATSQRPITRSGTIINRGGGRGNRYVNRVRTGATSQRPITRSDHQPGWWAREPVHQPADRLGGRSRDRRGRRRYGAFGDLFPSYPSVGLWRTQRHGRAGRASRCAGQVAAPVRACAASWLPGRVQAAWGYGPVRGGGPLRLWG